VRRFLIEAQKRPHIFVFAMIAQNALARPQAVLDLSPAQVNLEGRFIELNLKGRHQTKKYRPTVPVTDTLMPFLRNSGVKRFVMWSGNPIRSVKKTFARTVRKAGLPSEIAPYSLRHTMTTELRQRGVPPWEVEGLLGHRRSGVTEKYAHFQLGYLTKGREAIDCYFADLGLTYTVPQLDCVSVACHHRETEGHEEANLSMISAGWVVDTTGNR
jgi:integrase